MVFTLDLSGRMPSFFSSTMAWRETFSASARCSGVSTSLGEILEYGTISGGSNMPSWKRALKRRFRFTSTSCWLMRPFCMGSREVGALWVWQREWLLVWGVKDWGVG